MEQEKLDRILFVPCAFPPHKRPEYLAEGRHRLQMIRLASRGNRHFVADDLELRRGGLSYSVDTLTQFHQRWPDTDFFFLIGADSLPELLKWREIKRLSRLCRFLVVERPGFPSQKGPDGIRCRWVRGHTCELSSRDIRLRLARRQSIRYLVPDAVRQYILRHDLYR